MSAVDALNAAFAADPNAIHALLCNRVPCNTELADDPHVVCEPTPPLGDTKETYHVGALGLINAVLTASGLPRVAAKYSDTADEYGRAALLGFVEYPTASKLPSDEFGKSPLACYPTMRFAIDRNAWLSQAATHHVATTGKLWIPGMDDELSPPNEEAIPTGFYGWEERGYNTGHVIIDGNAQAEVPPIPPNSPKEWSGPPKAWPGPWSENAVFGRQVGGRARREAEPNPRDDASH
jgi:hypothetical protein